MSLRLPDGIQCQISGPLLGLFCTVGFIHCQWPARGLQQAVFIGFRRVRHTVDAHKVFAGHLVRDFVL